ncbi:unnamed protein product [Eruca vesicaria subsp. sativa]|uniref:Defensin-like protein n=1 Tax=Eruca vesicaria subsp. sativa TaxID=29727 RepID=A0ABC8IVD5_ERUVS|nr:unnamed protein product [Eruca vesicaria subsp. sativa]
MQRTTSLIFLVLIMFTSVVNQSRASICYETLGICDLNCSQRCQAKYGPSVHVQCTNGQCTCFYQCGPPPKVCYGGAGFCSDDCNGDCCNMNCANKYLAGHGSCLTLVINKNSHIQQKLNASN